MQFHAILLCRCVTGCTRNCRGLDTNWPRGASVIEGLRTVLTKYEGFCARLGPRGKSISLQGLLESTKKDKGNHAFFRDN